MTYMQQNTSYECAKLMQQNTVIINMQNVAKLTMYKYRGVLRALIHFRLLVCTNFSYFQIARGSLIYSSVMQFVQIE